MKTKITKTTILVLTAFAYFAPASFTTMKGMLIPVLAAQVSFDRDIRPIFAERCLGCHGEKKQSGGLRLDAKAFALRGGQNGPCWR